MKRYDAETAELIKQLSATANAYRPAILLLTANHAGLFSNLAGKSLTAAQIASMQNWNLRAAEGLLNALVALGYLKKEQGRYANSDISARLLVKGGDAYQGDMLNHNLHLWERWGRIGEVLRTGRSLRDPHKRRSEDELRDFIGAMANIGRLSAFLLWDKVDLARRERLLDLGGGPGTYSLIACQLFPALEAVVYDLPEVEPIFREECEKAGMSNRVKFQAGDFHADPLPDGFDVALLSSIIHSYGEAENRALLGKVYAALQPGGLVLIKDFYISADGTEPFFAALFAVNMIINTESGGCYTRSAVENWLQETGFVIAGYFDLTERAGVIIAQKS